MLVVPTRPVARPVHWVQLHPLRVQLHPLALRFAPYALEVQDLAIIIALPYRLHCKWFCTLWDFDLATGLVPTHRYSYDALLSSRPLIPIPWHSAINPGLVTDRCQPSGVWRSPSMQWLLTVYSSGQRYDTGRGQLVRSAAGDGGLRRYQDANTNIHQTRFQLKVDTDIVTETVSHC